MVAVVVELEVETELMEVLVEEQDGRHRVHQEQQEQEIKEVLVVIVLRLQGITQIVEERLEEEEIRQ